MFYVFLQSLKVTVWLQKTGNNTLKFYKITFFLDNYGDDLRFHLQQYEITWI